MANNENMYVLVVEHQPGSSVDFARWYCPGVPLEMQVDGLVRHLAGQEAGFTTWGRLYRDTMFPLLNPDPGMMNVEREWYEAIRWELIWREQKKNTKKRRGGGWGRVYIIVFGWEGRPGCLMVKAPNTDHWEPVYHPKNYTPHSVSREYLSFSCRSSGHGSRGLLPLSWPRKPGPRLESWNAGISFVDVDLCLWIDDRTTKALRNCSSPNHFALARSVRDVQPERTEFRPQSRPEAFSLTSERVPVEPGVGNGSIAAFTALLWSVCGPTMERAPAT
ncbi:hypothetical protein QBC40DRAFT_292285 [Triangularia verruculosa]|uniref:Uncharacterized protein n=1 Tax=Triangularia verruculosa TaxID=2587418 RepID=A0AAN6XWP3_9PEZI|nr:hypothetical protein QBC40DRAFT_292285 [Triangularia verruculosa]